MATNVLELNASDFEKEVLKSDIPVLVDFGAQWCMPCRMVEPIVNELSEDFKGRIKFAKVDVDNNPQLATDLQIMSIPHLVIFKKGEVVKRITGANPKPYIQKQIESVL